MLRVLNKIILFTVLCIHHPSHADNRWGGTSPVSLVLIGEGLILASSKIASKSPEKFGLLQALYFPLVSIVNGKDYSASTNTAWIVAGESFALSNIDTDEDRKTEDDIFEKNVVAWHLLFGIVGLTGYLSGDFDDDKTLAVTPTTNNGINIAFNYKF